MEYGMSECRIPYRHILIVPDTSESYIDVFQETNGPE